MIQKNLHEGVFLFLESLKKKDNNYFYNPMLVGLTKHGKSLNLGFSTYALKIFYIYGYWNELNENEKTKWINNLNSFQTSISNLPTNSYIDSALYNFYISPPNSKLLKNNLKRIFSKISSQNFITLENQLLNAVRAETKQSISTLHQVGYVNNKKYSNFAKSNSEINNFLESFNWEYPWSAGANFSSLCVFSKTQLDSDNYLRNRISLMNYIKLKANSETGGYYSNKTPSNNEIINGSMKVITGLDWLDEEIHYPKKLIDFCLSTKPNSNGCDIVDIIYVLFKCSELTNHRKKEIFEYFKNLSEIIFSHYFSKFGAFSYYKNKSQQYYNGIVISKGQKTPDLHGTLLLSWGLSMIEVFSEKNIDKWNIIKP